MHMPPFKAALRVYIVLRITATLWAILIMALFPLGYEPGSQKEIDFHTAIPNDNTFSQWFVAPWFRWDTQWYIVIAHEGYHRLFLTAFLPLYPLLVGLLGRLLCGEYLLAALIVSNLATLIALALLYELVRTHYTERLAHRVLWYIALFPASFFLIAAYTESLFLALVLGTFVAAERSRWGWAGVCGFLAIFTRWQGIALIPALIWMIYAEKRQAHSL
jgi:Gpi18-like mannosyltransferase